MQPRKGQHQEHLSLPGLFVLTPHHELFTHRDPDLDLSTLTHLHFQFHPLPPNFLSPSTPLHTHAPRVVSQIRNRDGKPVNRDTRKATFKLTVEAASTAGAVALHSTVARKDRQTDGQRHCFTGSLTSSTAGRPILTNTTWNVSNAAAAAAAASWCIYNRLDKTRRSWPFTTPAGLNSSWLATRLIFSTALICYLVRVITPCIVN